MAQLNITEHGEIQLLDQGDFVYLQQDYGSELIFMAVQTTNAEYGLKFFSLKDGSKWREGHLPYDASYEEIVEYFESTETIRDLKIIKNSSAKIDFSF
jgi:hypothetical protein